MSSKIFTYEYGYKLGQQNFKRYIFFPYEKRELAKKILRKRSNNIDVYETILLKSKDNYMFGPLYFDLDGEISNEEEFKLVQTDLKILYKILTVKLDIEENNINIFFSGAKGFHVTVVPSAIGINKPHEKLNSLYRKIAVYMNENLLSKSIDTAIYDESRLLRIENSINSKTGLYKVELSPEFAKNCSLKEIIEYSKTKKENIVELIRDGSKCSKNTKIVLKKIIKEVLENEKKEKLKQNEYISKEETQLRNLLPCIKNAILKGCSSGDRNNTCIMLLTSMRKANVDYDKMILAIEKWNDNTSPSLPQSEVDLCIKSSEKMVCNQRSYGCRSYKERGYCIEGEENDERCSIIKMKRKNERNRAYGK